MAHAPGGGGQACCCARVPWLACAAPSGVVMMPACFFFFFFFFFFANEWSEEGGSQENDGMGREQAIPAGRAALALQLRAGFAPIRGLPRPDYAGRSVARLPILPCGAARITGEAGWRRGERRWWGAEPCVLRHPTVVQRQLDREQEEEEEGGGGGAEEEEKEEDEEDEEIKCNGGCWSSPSYGLRFSLVWIVCSCACIL